MRFLRGGDPGDETPPRPVRPRELDDDDRRGPDPVLALWDAILASLTAEARRMKWTDECDHD